MPISTNLNVSPYYDDFDSTKDFYKILFRPGEAVQTRELNQLQTILQKQIERFGNHILKTGTIVDGCQVTYHNDISFAKIKDTTIANRTVSVSDYVGLVAKNSANLSAYIIDSASGFESQDPNLNTIYIRYRNSSNTRVANSYSNGDILTVYNNDYRLYSVKVTAGSSGFTNSDPVIFTSALELQNSTGGTTFSNSFVVGETVTQTSTGARGEVVSVDTTSNTTATVLKIAPLASDLAVSNTDAYSSWASGYEITGANSATTANTVGLVGSGATASVITAAGGRISNVNLIASGNGYYVAPYVSVSSDTATEGEIGLLDITAANYIANVTIASVANSTGNSYAVTVSDGVIYQKGYFQRVEKQFIIVEKYSASPDQKVVGFQTTESIVNSNSDSSLLDNATGTLNENAPGANRLKLLPTLVVKTTQQAEGNSEFFPIAEFSEGKPYKQYRSTQYDVLGQELARRTLEESGNYSLDPFQTTTRSPTTFSNEANVVSLVIDPGHAYISGYRVQTVQNFVQSINKAKDTVTATNTSIDLVYGNYIRVNEVGGFHDFSTGSQVSLRDTASTYLTSTPGAAITAGAGTEIGKARIRSLVFESGEPGTPSAVYRLYIFDIKMNVGKNFKDVRSVYYNGTSYDGVVDVVTQTDVTTGNQIAVVREKKKNSLLVGSDKIRALKSATNISYSYRTTDDTLESNTAGVITLTAGAGEEWPYSGVLTSTEERDLVVVPLVDIVSDANSSGSVTITGANVAGTSTDFVTEFDAGDYVYFNDGANTDISRVVSVTNSTFMAVSPSPASIGAGANIALAFPRNVPVPLHSRTGRTANVIGTSLHINLGTSIGATSNVAVTYNIKVSNATPITKTVVRKNYVKIQANTHGSNTVGPWCLGFSDIFRLRGVYAGANTTDTDITNEFYIDHNQNSNYYDAGFLYKKPGSTYSVSNDAILLVEFDLLTHSGEGVKTLGSYNIDDQLTLAQHDANTTMNTLEIPEVWTTETLDGGQYYDLRDIFDFRPRTVNTVAQAAVETSAPTNPAEPSEATRFSASGKKFPVPEGDLFLDYEYYIPRNDTVIVKSGGKFEVLTDEIRESGRKDEMIISYLTIPPYPSLPDSFSSDLIDITDTKVANEKNTNKRVFDYRIKNVPVNDQPRGYTMEDIGKLERRIESLEYYARLTEIEDEVANRVITSSVDTTLDRYKFGFFVDNFTSYNFSDLQSPDYKAERFEYRLYPQRENLAIEYKISGNTNNDSITSGNLAHFPYVRHELVCQMNATDGPITNTTSNTSTPNYALTCVNIQNKNQSYDRNASPKVVEENVFVLSQNTQSNGVTCSIYFDVFIENDRFEIYQSDDPESFTGSAITTSELCTTLTQANRNTLTNDKVFLNNSTYRNGDWSVANRPDFTRADNGAETNYWVKNAGKITFSYNIANGRYILIRVVKGSPKHSYRFCYPVDDFSDPVPDPTTKPPAKPKPKPKPKKVTKTLPKPRSRVLPDHDNDRGNDMH